MQQLTSSIHNSSRCRCHQRGAAGLAPLPRALQQRVAVALRRSAGRPAAASPAAAAAAAAAASSQAFFSCHKRRRGSTRCAALPVDEASNAALAAAAASAAATAPIPPATFEPHIDPTVVYGQLAVLALTLGAAAYWWWSVVPSARRTLAKEKRTGALRQYLEEIQTNDSRGLERWFYTDWLKKLERQQEMARRGAERRAAAAAAAAGGATTEGEGAAPLAAEGAAGEGSAPQQQQQQQQQSEEVYVDREPAFFSLDNPLIATATLVLGFGALNALVHALTGGS